MANNPVLLTVGSINGTTSIVVDTSGGINGGYAGAVRVQLTTDYTIVRPPGYPTRPGLTGAAVLDFPGEVLASGSEIDLLAPEAAALIEAGAATLIAYR